LASARAASGAKRAVSGARRISVLGISILSKNEALASAGRIDAALPVYFQIRHPKNKEPQGHRYREASREMISLRSSAGLINIILFGESERASEVNCFLQ